MLVVDPHQQFTCASKYVIWCACAKLIASNNDRERLDTAMSIKIFPSGKGGRGGGGGGGGGGGAILVNSVSTLAMGELRANI